MTAGTTRAWRDWTVREVPGVASTNDLARALPAWQAVRAVIQTGGRGRHGRTWRSGEGGLWMSAVLPLDPPSRDWAAFPLAAGLAVATYLRSLGVGTARLRWPNDILVDDRKIAGILMEKFRRDLMVVGLGLNMFNDPAAGDPSLERVTTTLSRCLPQSPAVEEAFHEILAALRAVHGRIAEEGFASLVDEINHLWDGERIVELTLAGENVRGRFLGVDARGDLLLAREGAVPVAYDASRVAMLREVG